MNNEITIALTSCGRYKLLKKTIESLGKNIDLSQYNKIMTEDSKNVSYLEKIKKENIHGFLKGWTILYTAGSNQLESYKSHYFAIKKLYQNIKTPYIFHLEDDWFFKKVNFDLVQISKQILDSNDNISIVLLRNYEKDGGLESSTLSREERRKELFLDLFIEVNNLKFNYMNPSDSTHGFSLNPGLRKTQEMKELMFSDNEERINEGKYGLKLIETHKKVVCLTPGVVYHIGGGIHTTSLNNIFNNGLINGIKNIFCNILYNSFKYRSKLLLRKLGFEKLLSHEIKQKYYLKIMESPIGYPIDFLLGIYRKNKIKEVDESILNNIEGIKELNIPISWFTENKPLGISGVARLKNSDDFLEKIIESYIPYLDEIILVNNLSTDKTEEICKKLLEKYPEKIKYFEYPYALGGYVGEKDYPTNSIYSLAYYYNWCFSKTKYKYVMKLDDDNLPIPDKWEKIRKYILEKQPNKYCTYWGYNILKKGNLFGFFRKEIYSGSGGDHGIYPVGVKTYYIQYGIYEKFVFALKYCRFGFSFLHLKYLKEQKGQTNLSNRMNYLKFEDNYFYNNFIKTTNRKIIKELNIFFKLK